MIPCFIFDLDGVIVNTAKYHFLAWKEIADELNIPFSETENEKLKGVSREQSLAIILELGNLKISKQKFEELCQKKNQIYLGLVHKIDKDEILPGVLEKLNLIKKENRKIVLASSSKNAKLVLDKTGIASIFDFIIDGNEAVRAKPAPDIFLLAAQKTMIEPQNCLVFEDSAAGIEAAKKAGMKTIGIGDVTSLKKADFVFENFYSFSIDFLLNL